MKRIQQSMVLAGLLALGLAGCKSTTGGGSSADMTGAGSTSSGSSSTGGSMGSGGTAGAQDSGSARTGATQGMPGQASQGAPGSSMASAPNAVVTLIEVVPRQSAGAATGADTTGSSAVGGTGTTGTTGSSMGADQVYRVTMLMDDGSTQVVTLDQAPTFRSGDRVNMSGGTITH